MSQMSFGFEAPANPVVTFARDDAKKSVAFLIDQATNYGSSEAFAKLLKSIARFHQYKPVNALLAQLQLPGATFVLPPQRWEQQYHRVVTSGERPIVMLQPFGPVMFVYDVSQTEALPNAPQLSSLIVDPYAMPPIKDAESAVHWLVQNAKVDGVRVTFVAAGSQSAGCIRAADNGLHQDAMIKRGGAVRSTPIRYEIETNRSQTPTQHLATLAHELGHLYSGHVGTHDLKLWSSRTRLDEAQTEIEAEAVAFLVCQRRDPTAKLPPHLHQYVSSGAELPPYDFNKILTSAGRVLEMSEGWAPRRPKTAKEKPIGLLSVTGSVTG